VHALAWLLIPALTGVITSGWAWYAGHRHTHPVTSDDSWQDMHRYATMRSAFDGPRPTRAHQESAGTAATGVHLWGCLGRVSQRSSRS
jgi:hypothetical protein